MRTGVYSNLYVKFQSQAHSVRRPKPGETVTVTVPDWKQHVHVKRIGQPCQWAEDPAAAALASPRGLQVSRAALSFVSGVMKYC